MFTDRKYSQQTAIGEQLERAGYSKPEMELFPAAVKFFSSGGSMEAYERTGNRAVKSVSNPKQSMDGFMKIGHKAQKFVSDRAVMTERNKQAATMAVKIKEKIVERLVDKIMTSDGRRWGGVSPIEFKGMQRDARMSVAIEKVLGPLNQKQLQMPLRDLMTDDQFKRAIKAGEE